MLIDNAMWLVENHIPLYDEDTLISALELAIGECHRNGLTGIHDAGVSKDDIALYQRAIVAGKFNLRDYVFLKCDQGVYFCGDETSRVDEFEGRMTVRAVKMYLDGALGSWGAAMLEPYSDKPDSKGLLRMPVAELEPAVRKWVNLGFQVNTHAIGDHANRVALDAYEKVIYDVGVDLRLRLRIEHAQIVSPKDFERFRELHVIPSVQPTHATSDMAYAEKRLGHERIRGAYAWRTLAAQAEGHLPLSSDFPVEKMNPFHGIYAAVTRQDLSGQPAGGWYPEEKLTVLQAVRGFTTEAAYAAFQEDSLGSLVQGRRADFIVIDRDIIAGKPEDIPGTTVITTFFDGNPVYGRRFEPTRKRM